jgi:hypothetical protein
MQAIYTNVYILCNRHHGCRWPFYSAGILSEGIGCPEIVSGTSAERKGEMKKCVLAVLMLASMASTLAAAEEEKVVQVIFIGRDEIRGGLVYDQFDENGSNRRCLVLEVGALVSSEVKTELRCTKWVRARKN